MHARPDCDRPKPRSRADGLAFARAPDRKPAPCLAHRAGFGYDAHEVSTGQKIWDCYPWEMGEPYAAFSAWLHVGPSRPTPEVWASMRGDTRIATWATAGLWQQRAAHYDRETATREVVRRIPLFSGIAPRLLGLVEGRIRDLEAQAASGVVEVVSTRDMIALARLLVSLQREARAVAESEAEDEKGALPVDGADDVDYSALTIDELREFQALLAKATARAPAKGASGPVEVSPFASSPFHVKH